MNTAGRAYAVFETKAVDEQRRIFTGWATTPAPDRVQDTIDPMGAVFKNPLVLLHQHRHDAPIGTVTFERPTKSGIQFTAEIPVIDQPGPLKDRVDTAWGEIKAGIVRAVSVGFRPLKYAYREDGGIDFQEVEIFELSTVSIPANADAVITAIKSLDRAAMAEAGVVQPEFAAKPEQAAALVQPEGKPAASGKGLPVVKLADPARVRAKPFVIRKIHT
ncbi:peptidase U35 [Cereibacter sphaeroides]|uniref:Peptidase U35 n=2 Tax=Cereibacter sphaeroides TaxID=1063 RepID=A0AAX1UP73_CERSP|nr:peptidase U35 [Cereibacter sphaeroides]